MPKTSRGMPENTKSILIINDDARGVRQLEYEVYRQQYISMLHNIPLGKKQKMRANEEDEETLADQAQVAQLSLYRASVIEERIESVLLG
jgi:hypothetical protein